MLFFSIFLYCSGVLCEVARCHVYRLPDVSHGFRQRGRIHAFAWCAYLLLLPARAAWPHSPRLARAHAAHASLRRKPGVGGGSLQIRSAALCCVKLASVLASDAMRRTWLGFRCHVSSTCHSSRLRRAPPSACRQATTSPSSSFGHTLWEQSSDHVCGSSSLRV